MTTAASPTSAPWKRRAASPRAPRRSTWEARPCCPGSSTPHSHFTGALQYLLYADLSECTSFAEITETLKKFAAERNIGPDGVIMGNGYDQNNLIEQRHPDKSILNAVSEDVPVLITHVSNHMGVANDWLLKLAGITPTTPTPRAAATDV